MNTERPFHALILAAGTGQRFGGHTPKQYEMLHGKRVLRHSIDIFLQHPNLKSLHIVIDPQHENLYHETVHGLELPDYIPGGEDRKTSCLNGLLKLSHLKNDDAILIHDGARALLTHHDIDLILESLQKHDSVTLGQRVGDTLRRTDQSDIVAETIPRQNCWTIQTPQGFRYGKLRAAHDTYAAHDHFTDDCGIMEMAGHSTKIIEGSPHNIKITWPHDLQRAAQYMDHNMIIRTGTGFDVHAFGTEQVETIRLGGIDVPYHRNLTAHSDGDVVLHALTDAMLGAIGAGDIGLHFPPSDPQWKGKDSAFFLEAARDMLQKSNSIIHNIDITIIGEAPKLTPVRDAMRARIASLLHINETKVNVKATTTEKLGFAGRGEGIATQAQITISMKEIA